MGLLNDILKHSDLKPTQLMSCIDEYEAVQPYDCMIDTARAVVSFFAEDYGTAEKWIQSALRKNPGNHMNHFYYALIAKALGNYTTAVVECWIAINFATQFGTPPGWNDMLKQLNDVMLEVGPKLDRDGLQEFVFRRNILQSPGSFFPAYYIYEKKQWSVFVGKFLYYDPWRDYNDYVGFWGQAHMDLFSHTLSQLLKSAGDYNLYAVTPTETWKAQKGSMFELKQEGQIVAVAAAAANQKISITPDKGRSVDFTLAAPDIYHYINMDQPGKLSSDQDFVASKPIRTKGIPGKRRLILTIFMDALSQRYLTDTNFAYMPHTREFFGKGTIFKNCYATGEWTHPSVASLNTGLYTTHHHITYRSSAYQYPPQSKTISEIFNENGYFTAYISGSVGVSPYLGGLRGFDRAIHKSALGFPDEHLIADALDHLDAFPEANKFVHLGLCDVHRSMEDTTEQALSVAMPQQTLLGFRDAMAKTNHDEKSVWMRYAESHIPKYQAALRNFDRQIKAVYDYITEHYDEDEYLVCLYSDHGTPALNHEEYLLKKMQTNSVLMLRGGGVPAQISEEYINHFDYIPILAKLANIPFDFSGHDCVLPRAFGGSGRDFVYTESIYHGQSYKAAVRTEEFECQFETVGFTDNDGLIDLSTGFTMKILSMQTGEEIQDRELVEDFEAIVFDHIKENIKY